MALAIRPATASDLDALERLENAVFPGDRLSRRALAHSIKVPSLTVLIADAGDALAGYVLVAFRRNSALARVYSIAVDPDFGGRGLGRALMAAAEDEAMRRQMARVRLEVRADNAAAIGLYERLGYGRFGHYEDYYEDGAAALRLEKALAVAPSSIRTGRRRPER